MDCSLYQRKGDKQRKFYALGAQAVGDFGPNAIVDDYQERPPKVQRFHLELDRWPKDDIVEVLATYAVTDKLAAQLKQSKLVGFTIDDIEVSTSKEFEEWRSLHLAENLPKFRWLKVHGKPGIDDFGLIKGPCELPLIISEKGLKALQQHNLEMCDIEDYLQQELPATG